MLREPRSRIVEKISSRGGSGTAERAADEHPDKVNLDSEGELL